jgi:spore maturation protein CgeB
MLYYLANDEERKRIADAGQQLAFEKHSFDVRVQELFDLLGRKTTQVSEFEDWR